MKVTEGSWARLCDTESVEQWSFDKTLRSIDRILSEDTATERVFYEDTDGDVKGPLIIHGGWQTGPLIKH